MKNRNLTLLMTAFLGLASVPGALAQSIAAAAASSQSTADPRLAPANVSLEIGTYSGPLSSLLAAVAKSAGYDVIFDTDVDRLGASAAATQTAPSSGLGTAPATTAAPAQNKPVVYNFRNTPFNQVWPLLMDIYGLSYEVVQVGPGQVLRISANPIQRVIALKNASAVDAVNQVKLFFGTPTYNEVPQKDAQGNVIGTSRTLADVKIDSPTLRIVADTRTNSLIVRGTNREVADVQRLAAQLDQQVATAATSSATDSTTVQRIYKVQGQQADIVALLAAQYPTLKVTAVGQTGTLVVTGPQNVLDAALNLLTSVDRPTPVVTVSAGPTIIQKVFQLTNASADDVKAVLQGTLQRDLGASTGLVGNATPLIQPDGTTVIQPPTTTTAATGTAGTTSATASQATIISDKRTNTLIVRGTQAQVDQIAQIIPSLDVPVPQVNLQVRIQEINETASRSLGVDWKAGFGNFVVNVASTAVKAIFDPTQALMGFNLGATLTALENQGLTKRVYDGAVTMQSGQRSLGGSTATQNASSGAAAHVQSGGRIELNIPAGSGVAAIQKQIDYGVTLDFYGPQVAPDGTITVRVAGKVTGEPGAITDGQVIRFTNSEAQTTITFKAGETVLLSGLLGTDQATTTAGVPFLSSIPIIGTLFGQQTSRNTRSQLLVVITGNVLQ